MHPMWILQAFSARCQGLDGDGWVDPDKHLRWEAQAETEVFFGIGGNAPKKKILVHIDTNFSNLVQ